MKSHIAFTLTALSLMVSAFFLGAPAQADTPPTCFARQNVVAVNNDQVTQWKSSTPAHFLARAHITGHVTKIYHDETGHSHFQVTMSSQADATIEVIYNQEFGHLPPPIAITDAVEACGDYITAPLHTPNASPDGAILHWVHLSPDLQRHDSGYVAINGVTYGLDSEDSN